MYGVEIDNELFDEIHEQISSKAAAMGNLKGSIEGGDGNYAGLFGEMLFLHEFGGEGDSTYNHDIRYDGMTVDVKTKRRSVEPEPYYECSIADYNTEQDADIYYFVSVLYDYSEAWMLGYLETDDYYEIAEFHEEGDVDDDNGFEFKADCWNVPISDLDTFDNEDS